MISFRAIEVTFPINFKRLKPRKMKIYLKIKTLQSSFSFFQKLILSSFNLITFITKDDRRQSSRANEGLPSSLDSQGSNTSDDRRILSFQTDSKNSSYPLKSPPMLISRVLERTITPWTTSPPHWTTPSNPRKVPRGYNTHRIRCSQKTEETRFFSSGMMPIAVETGTTEKRRPEHHVELFPTNVQCWFFSQKIVEILVTLFTTSVQRLNKSFKSENI